MLGRRQYAVMQVASDNVQHTTKELLEGAARIEIEHDWPKAGQAQHYLRDRGDCFWRTDTQYVLTILVGRGLLKRMKVGYYRITRKGTDEYNRANANRNK